MTVSPINSTKAFDATALRSILGDFATGVTVLACDGNDQPIAMTANAFTSVSLEPPLVLVSIAQNARMLKFMKRGSEFTVNILGGEQEAIARCYGGRDKVYDNAHWAVEHGLPVIAEAAAHFGCEVVARHRHGTHMLVIAAVNWIARNPDINVLTFHRGRFGKSQSE